MDPAPAISSVPAGNRCREAPCPGHHGRERNAGGVARYDMLRHPARLSRCCAPPRMPAACRGRRSTAAPPGGPLARRGALPVDNHRGRKIRRGCRPPWEARQRPARSARRPAATWWVRAQMGAARPTAAPARPAKRDANVVAGCSRAPIAGSLPASPPTHICLVHSSPCPHRTQPPISRTLPMSSATSPLALPFPDAPPIAGVTPRVARARYKAWDRCDLTFVTLDPGTAVAGVLTQSKCPSPEVEWCRDALVLGQARALVVNAGNSNAFTGNRGRE